MKPGSDDQDYRINVKKEIKFYKTGIISIICYF